MNWSCLFLSCTHPHTHTHAHTHHPFLTNGRPSDDLDHEPSQVTHDPWSRVTEVTGRTGF